jgi:hypothetical protein
MRAHSFPLQIFAVLLATHFINPVITSGQIQKSDKEVSFEYDRNSLSLLLIEYKNDRLSNSFKSQFKPEVGDKFFFNPIANNQFPADLERPSEEPAHQQATNKSLEESIQGIADVFTNKGGEKPISEQEKIRLALESKNIGWDIIKLWSEQDAQGNFTTLQKRVSYNYSAVDDQGSIDAKKIANIKPLFLRNYILVFDFKNLSDQRSYYAKKKTEMKEIPDGIIADLTVYFYQLDVSDDLFDNFIKPNFDKPVVLKGKTYPISYVRKQVATVQKIRPAKDASGKRVSDDELYNGLIKDAIEKACFYLERKSDDFKAKDVVLETNPSIKGTVGAREGVRIDQRFYVYEKRYNEKTKTTSTKRIAMLRATNKVGNNLTTLKDSQGNYITTTFRKIYGRKVEPGMLLVQQKDIGLSISAGAYHLGETNDFGLHAAYNISPLFQAVSETANFSGTRIFLDISIGKRPADDISTFNEDEKATRAGIGISKDLQLNNIIDLVPYAGYYSYAFTDNKDLHEQYVKIGARIPINIYYNTFLVADFGFTTESDFTNVSRFPIGAMLRIDF